MFCHDCGEQLEEDFIYCPSCGIKKDTNQLSYRHLLSQEAVSEKEAIKRYFYSGFNYETIIGFLLKYNGIAMSISTLKKKVVFLWFLSRDLSQCFCM